MRKAIASAALIAASLSLYATDAVWTNTSASAQTWTVAANWTNVLDGAALTTPPTQATDTVTFPFVDRRLRTVNIYNPSYTQGDASSGSYTVASVSGPKYWQIQLPGTAYSWGSVRRTFTCADVNGFSGRWVAAGPLQTLALTAESGVQTLETVSARNRLKIDVRNAAAEARVNVVTDPGAIEKNGAGKLTLGAMVHDSQDVYVNKGVLELEGVAVDCSDLFARAVVHLDASRADTMTGYTGDDGRHYVTNWGHASGGTIGAELWDNSADTASGHIRYPHAPFINSNDVASTGLPLMDFGARSPANVATLGPTNCTLRFTQELNGVREVFYVNLHSDSSSFTGYLLCPANADIFSGNQNYTFKYYYNRPALYNGIVTMNGVERLPVIASNNQLQIARPKDDYSPTWDSMTETGVALAEGISLSYLCGDMLKQGYAGGMRVAEVLIYTNVLTQAERREINTYLMRKWFADYTCQDVATLHVGSDSTVAVSVPAGHVAHVGTALLKSGATLVKTGGGRLEIDTIEPRNATVEIRGGSVKITPSGDTISTTAPASNPLFWLDAESNNAFTKDGDNITSWRDCRSTYADARGTTSVDQGSGFPTEVSVEINGVSHTAVQFPKTGSSKGAYMDFSPNSWNQTEAFVVIRFDTTAYSQQYPIIGMRTSRKNTRDTCNIFGPGGCDDGWGGTSATVNGVPLDPFGASNASDTIWAGDTWYVVAISSNTGGSGISLRLAGHRDGDSGGGVCIAEYIGYNRKLTTNERRNTVAYLMNKWQNSVHPDAQDRGLPAYTFSSDTPVVLSSDEDITVEACTGGNGIIAKDGAGTVTVDDTISAYTNLAVFAGELAFTKIPFTDKSYMHFDASDTSTFTETFVDEDGAKTNVAKWVDVRNSNIYFTKYATANTFSTNPVVRVVETRAGQYRQMLDFGMARNRANSQTYKDCAAMLIDGSHRTLNFVEAYEIFSDAHNCSAGLTFGSNRHDSFSRGGSGTWLTSYYTSGGYLAVDGVEVAKTQNIHDGFHLLTIIPDSAINISAIGKGKADNMIGGFYVGELLAFTSPQTPEERVYLQRSLMHKWFGTAAAEWTNEVDAVTLAAGGRLKVADNNVLVVPSLSGSGTVEAPAVVGIESLAIDIVDGLPTCIEVAGDAVFAANVTATFGSGISRLPAGDYTIFRATGSIDGADTANWSVVPAAARHRTFDVVAVGNEVKLRVTTDGSIIIVM